MTPETDVLHLQRHLALCSLCKEIVSQMHPKCLVRRPVDDSMLAECERERVKRVDALLQRAVRILGTGKGDAHADICNLQYVVEQARRATRHILDLGALTDSDLAAAGMPVKRLRIRFGRAKAVARIKRQQVQTRGTTE